MFHYKPDHFVIQELIPPPVELPLRLRTIYDKEPGALFRCFPWQLLVTLDRFRDRYGPTTVNDWFFSKSVGPNQFRHSGYRPFDCKEGAPMSEHRFFRGADAKPERVKPPEVWDDMRKNPGLPVFEHIQRIEAGEGMTWVHFDLGQHPRAGRAVYVVPYGGNRAGLPQYIERMGAAA